MDEQNARRADSGAKIHDYAPENTTGGNSQQQAVGGQDLGRARTFESQDDVGQAGRARAFESQEDVGQAGRARTFESQDDVAQAAQESPEVAKVSVDTTQTAASLAHMLFGWHREVYGFINSRLDKNIQFFRQVSDMSGPSDFGRIQSQFAQEAITDYTFGVQQVLARSLSAAGDGGEHMRHGAEKAASHLRSGAQHLAPRN